MKEIKFIVFTILALSFVNVFAQNGGTQQNRIGRAGTFAITNARIVTVSGAEIPNGTLIIKNGKIAALGAGIVVPADAEKIDGTGLSVYPGMIDAGTNMGLLEIGGGAEGTVDVAETGDFNANAKAILGLNPNTSHINVTRVSGVTTTQSLPVGSLIAGQSAIINLNGETQDEMALVKEFALVVNFPVISTFGGFSPLTGRQTLTFSQAVKRRDERLKKLKEQFEAGAKYATVKDAETTDASLPKQNTDLWLEALTPFVRGEKPVIFVAQNAAEIRGAVKLAEELKLKAIIYGGGEAWKEAELLSKQKVPVIFTRIYSNPGEDDAYDEFFAAPALMKKAGVTFCISTGDDGANVRELPIQAGMASAYGLSKDDALKSVTLYPAQILGIADRVGSLEVGKDANVVVTDGDLLEIKTGVKYLFIGGRLLPLTSRHTELFDSFKDRTLPKTN
ncbi:MAG: amidohydrolase family protein [Pyrinomonadaceae bacterium]